MKKLLFIFLLFGIRQGKAQTYVLIPDPVFATYLQSVVPTAMSGNSLDITNTLVTTSTRTINVDIKVIYNLDGIQYFSSLEVLSCFNCRLTNIPPLPNTLKVLDCALNMSITALPALPNTLTLLRCFTNSLTTLPVLPNSLLDLQCYRNLLTTLPTLPNSLTFLDCSYNPLTSFPTLPNSLQTLNCNQNSLTSLPVLPYSLKTLNCYSNSLINLPSLPNSLNYLDCKSNSLTILPILTNSLYTLYCENNNITCFPDIPHTIWNINLNNNPFTCLPNHIAAMSPSLLAIPLCGAGNINGCPLAGLHELKQDNNLINIFPNPTNNQFTIETNSTEKQILNLFDLNGKSVFSKEIFGKTIFDVDDLNSGVYNLIIITENNISNKKLVIVK